MLQLTIGLETIAYKTIHLCHLPSASSIAIVLPQPLSNKLFHRVFRKYLYRKPKLVPIQKQNIIACIVKRVNYLTMGNTEKAQNLNVINNGANICFLGLK